MALAMRRSTERRFISRWYRGLGVTRRIAGTDSSLTVVGHHEWWNQGTTCISWRIDQPTGQLSRWLFCDSSIPLAWFLAYIYTQSVCRSAGDVHTVVVCTNVILRWIRWIWGSEIFIFSSLLLFYRLLKSSYPASDFLLKFEELDIATRACLCLDLA